MQRRHEINLPQMANKALSENWLLKEMGDMHWEMISKGLEKKSSEFQNAAGERLCAAFVRLFYSCSPLNHFAENSMLDMYGKIKRYSDCTYFSKINGYSGNNTVEAQLMSCFSAIKVNNNAGISKSTPVAMVNHIDKLDETPEMFSELRKLKKGQLRKLITGGYTFDISYNVIDEYNYTINPYYDINGVGLLYFAAYPFISDFCTAQYMQKAYSELNYGSSYHTVHRDIFYYGNCNADEKVIHHVNDVGILPDGKIQLSATMYREGDHSLIARVFTVKECSATDTHRLIWIKK